MFIIEFLNIEIYNEYFIIHPMYIRYKIHNIYNYVDILYNMF